MEIASLDIDVRKAKAGSGLKICIIGERRHRLRVVVGVQLLRVAAAIIRLRLAIFFVSERGHARQSQVAAGLPRALSTADPDFARYAPIDVRLDGQPMPDASAYDADAGTVTIARRNADGEIVVVGGEIMLATLEGVVQVTHVAK